MKFLKIKNRGFTLIELIFYFFIVSIVIFVAVSFAIQIVKMNSLSSNSKEVHANADFIENKIDKTIKRAISIDFGESVFDDDDGVLSLNMLDPSESPSKFYSSDGDLFLKIGQDDPVKLNSSFIGLKSFRFSVISSHKSPDQIKMEAKLGLKNTDVSGIDRIFDIYLVTSLRQL